MADLSSDPGWRDGATEVPGAASTDAGERAQGWDRLVVIYGLWVAVALAYWPSAVALNGFWTDTVNNAYTHGYLVLLVSMWLVVRDRRRVFAAPLKPEPRALAAIGILSLAWVYFYGAAIQDPQLLLLPLLLFAAIIAALGWPVARTLLFPVGFLYFAMPAWTDINFLLQWLSIKVNGILVWVTGIPAYLTGKYIHLPGGTLEIAFGCSGLHFFVVGLALAALYGELAGDSLRRRLFWLGLMGLFALIGNWVRIFVIVIAAYETNMKTYLVTVSHYAFGWAVFVAFFFLFLGLAGSLAHRWDRRRPVEGHTAPLQSPAAPSRDIVGVSLSHALTAFAALVVLPGLVYGRNLVWPVAGQGLRIDWPAAPAGWSGPERVSYSLWTPQYFNATAQSLRRYDTPRGRSVEVFAVAYRSQTQQGKLLGYWNSLLGDKAGLKPLGARIVRTATGRWRQLTVRDATGTRSIIWSRDAIGARHFVDARLSQLWYGIAAFTTRPVSSLTALRAICRPDCAAARARLNVAAAELVPTVRAEIGR